MKPMLTVRGNDLEVMKNYLLQMVKETKESISQKQAGAGQRPGQPNPSQAQAGAQQPPPPQPQPVQLRETERPPTDPRDHSLLETIYNEMHASRFVNLEPLSLLTNLLPIHFKGPSLLICNS